MSSEEYCRLKAFFKIYANKYFAPRIAGLLPEEHPVAVLETFEKKSMAQARKGLKTTVNDIVEMTADWRPSQVAAFDAELRSQEAMTLTEARQRYSSKYQRILKRGRIVSEEECYLIKGILDGGNLEPGMPEALNLEAMLEDYGNRATYPKKP